MDVINLIDELDEIVYVSSLIHMNFYILMKLGKRQWDLMIYPI